MTEGAMALGIVFISLTHAYTLYRYMKLRRAYEEEKEYTKHLKEENMDITLRNAELERRVYERENTDLYDDSDADD